MHASKRMDMNLATMAARPKKINAHAQLPKPKKHKIFAKKLMANLTEVKPCLQRLQFSTTQTTSC
jgi:hypothetical protein